MATAAIPARTKATRVATQTNKQSRRIERFLNGDYHVKKISFKILS